MKSNKFITSALVALGIVSLAGVAQANTVIYLTGSTAARALIFTAATTPGQIFTGGGTVVSSGSNTGNGANTIVYEGTMAGITGTVDLDCSFTGSEAGIAAVAGQVVKQTVNTSATPISGIAPNSNVNLPGIPTSFLVGPGWTTSSTLPIAGDGRGVSTPDLTMADTSQAVSQTSAATFPLVDYGIVGIVPFTIMKGYQSAPDAAYTDLVNVTTAELNQNLSAGDLYNANNYTGVAADSSDGVAIVGRNLGSGTRANSLLAFNYGINTAVDQFAFNVTYTAAGVLTFNGSYGPAANNVLWETVNDGFDSGGNVQKELNVDGSGQSVVLLGYLGTSDAFAALGGSAGTFPANAGSAIPLPYNGVYEGDTAVIEGNYPYWGEEHLLGSIGQVSTSAPGEAAADIVSGLSATLAAASGSGTSTFAAGHCPNNISVTKAQSILIPKGLMQVHRSGDTGYPLQGAFTH
jgi:hypothetical protein